MAAVYQPSEDLKELIFEHCSCYPGATYQNHDWCEKECQFHCAYIRLTVDIVIVHMNFLAWEHDKSRLQNETWNV